MKELFRKIIRERIAMVLDKNKKKTRVSYTGIVLYAQAKNRLLLFIKDMVKAKKINIPQDWIFSADHITINMGPAIDSSILGKVVAIKVLIYGFDENILAVGVNTAFNVEFEKENKHITVAYNPLTATPKMSNNIATWKPVPKSFIIFGKVQEVLQDL